MQSWSGLQDSIRHTWSSRYKQKVSANLKKFHSPSLFLKCFRSPTKFVWNSQMASFPSASLLGGIYGSSRSIMQIIHCHMLEPTSKCFRIRLEFGQNCKKSCDFKYVKRFTCFRRNFGFVLLFSWSESVGENNPSSLTFSVFMASSNTLSRKVQV